MNNVTTRGTLDWSTITRVPRPTTEDLRLVTGDVVFNNTNSAELVGKNALFAELAEPVYFSNHFTRLRADPSRLLPGYLAVWLQAKWQVGLFRDICNRWVGQAAVQREKLLALEIVVPSLLDQQRIVSALTRELAQVARARAAAEARREAANQLRPAFLRSIFHSVEAKQWPCVELRGVGAIVSGLTLGGKAREAREVRVPYLRVANVLDGRLDLSDVREIDVTASELDKWTLEYGDLLLTEGGDPDKLGRGTFWEGQIARCIHQNHIFRVRFDWERFDPRFIAAQLGSPYGKAYFLAHAKQTTGIASINQKVLGGFPLKSPPLAEQRRIAAALVEEAESFNSVRKAVEAELASTSALPAALLRLAFHGEL